MNPMINFYSVFAEQMQQFVAFKRMQGYDYTSQVKKLTYFDNFLLTELDGKPKPCLKLDILQHYANTTAHLGPFSRRVRLSSVREFTRFLHARSPNNAILPIDTVPRHPQKVRFYRIEPEQLADLIAATKTVMPSGSICSHSVGMLIGLLYCTALRINEALSLTLGNIDSQQLTLYVAKGKFSKQRLVPISPSTLAALNDYLVVRGPYAGTESSSPLFIGAYNKALSYWQAYDNFQRLCRHCGLSGKPLPRLHDLRHNYACRRLALWRKEGRDINAMLPILATAMGHTSIYHTQLYLHIELGELHDAATLLRTRLNTHLESIQ